MNAGCHCRLVFVTATILALAGSAATRAQAPPAAAQPQPTLNAPPPGTTPPASTPAPSAAAAPAAQPSTADARRPPPVARLPGEITTIQYLEVPDRRFQFKATAGAIPLYDASDGNLQAEIAYIAYVKSEGERTRPVTFVFNGGPGSASAYLQLGALGPWRLSLDHIVPSTTPTLVPNPETWLDFTDLVFVDPPGTGYSRIVASGDGARRQFWSVDGDAQALAVFIRKWVERSGRQVSPKFIVGESYGGFRAPKIARQLQEGQNVGVSGLVLISPVLDFGLRNLSPRLPESWVAHLPSMAATAREFKAGGESGFDRAALLEVEQYAAGDYLRDLLRGPRDQAAVERMSGRVAGFTGLDPDLVRRLGGRVDTGTFEREFYRAQAQVASSYDATVTAPDPNPNAARSRYSDPVLGAMAAPLTLAMTDLYQRVLHWRVEDQYRLQNGEVSNRWDFGSGRASPQAIDDIVHVLAIDRRVRLLVTHGASDLVTPYFETKLILDQLPVTVADRSTFALYGGGHMYYSRDSSRRALRADAEAMYRAAVPEDAARE
jgi:carboxypeptidase C (cathepsin A)